MVGRRSPKRAGPTLPADARLESGREIDTMRAAPGVPPPRNPHVPKFKVLLTDYAWPDLDIERLVLAQADAELIVAPATDAATLARLAADADAIMT